MATSVSFDFLAEDYDVDYPETADHEFLRALVRDHQNSDVLEVPCGSGRNLGVLSEGVKSLTLVDRSASMVDVVERKLSIASLKIVTALVGDMCTFELNRQFDLIVVPREAFQLVVGMHEREAAMATLARHLRPRTGRLVIDLATFVDIPNSRHPDYFSPGVPDGVRVLDWARPSSQGGSIERMRVQRRLQCDLLEIDFVYRRLIGDQQSPPFVLPLQFTLYTAEDIAELGGRHGLQLVSAYGDYDRCPLHTNGARIIVEFAVRT